MTYFAEVEYVTAFLVVVCLLGVVAWCLLEASDFLGRTAARRRIRRQRQSHRALNNVCTVEHRHVRVFTNHRGRTWQ